MEIERVYIAVCYESLEQGECFRFAEDGALCMKTGTGYVALSAGITHTSPCSNTKVFPVEAKVVFK